jgi:hypothetical protein
MPIWFRSSIVSAAHRSVASQVPRTVLLTFTYIDIVVTIALAARGAAPRAAAESEPRRVWMRASREVRKCRKTSEG